LYFLLIIGAKSMKKITDYLIQLGLSEIEAELYKGLLEFGPTTVMSLAERVGIKRITAHFNIEALIKKGLVSELKYGARRQIVAESPQRLEYLIEQKEGSLNEIKSKFPDMLGEMKVIMPNAVTDENVEVKYYEGKRGVKIIYEEALAGKELRSYVNIDIMYNKMPDNSKVFAEALKRNKSIKIYEIIEDSIRSREQTQFQEQNAENQRYFYKFLPKEVKLSAADTLIYDGKVSIINTTNKITGIVINNREYFYNSKELFDFTWRLLPEL
jgi:sugar-specific transcriptional regulator TrmB